MKLGLDIRHPRRPRSPRAGLVAPDGDGGRSNCVCGRSGRLWPVSGSGHFVPARTPGLLGARQSRPLGTRTGPACRDEFGGGTPSTETLDYLRELPFDLVVEHEKTIGVVVHGSPRSDMEFVTRQSHPPSVLRRYLLDLQCELLVVGHTHQPMWFRCADGLVVNPGSVVSAARIDSSRTFALVDLDILEVTFHDVESGEMIEVDPWN